MSDIWNARIYSEFLDLRTRPARDLLYAIPAEFNPKQVYDLGCGPGNSTILLKDRWPNANVAGIDSSLDMIQEAKATYPKIEFVHGNIAEFYPDIKADCIFANASLHWLGSHETLFPKLISILNPGGVLAVQMPNNFHYPTHQVSIELLQGNSDWHSLLKNLHYGHLEKALYQLPMYYDLVDQAGAKNIQLWETVYFQEMQNHQEIFNWVKGTGLRPVLSKMNAEDQIKFEKLYIEAISKVYLAQKNGKVILPFKRIFIVSYRSGSSL